MKSLLHDKSTADVQFSTISQEGRKEKKFYAHRIVLKARCPYFSGLLSHNWKENKTTTTTTTINNNNKEQNGLTNKKKKPQLPCFQTNLSKKVFSALLEYLYTGELQPKITRLNDLVELMIASDEYNLVHLKAICEQRLQSYLNKENCLELCHGALFYGCDQLLKASSFVLAQTKVYPSISQKKEFQQLDVECIQSIKKQYDLFTSLEQEKKQKERRLEYCETRLKACK
jgi:hypothetical protein